MFTPTSNLALLKNVVLEHHEHQWLSNTSISSGEVADFKRWFEFAIDARGRSYPEEETKPREHGRVPVLVDVLFDDMMSALLDPEQKFTHDDVARVLLYFRVECNWSIDDLTHELVALGEDQAAIEEWVNDNGCAGMDPSLIRLTLWNEIDQALTPGTCALIDYWTKNRVWSISSQLFGKQGPYRRAAA